MGRGWPDVCFKSSPAAELKQRYNLGLVELPQSSCRRFGQRRTKGSGVLDTALASAPESSLAWLDFDRAASERLSELLRALDEPGTLDVLGLGTVRDAFSAMLNPGTSTTQTRLRYFIFIPWIFAKLEQEQVLAAEFSRRLRDYESRLMDCLRHLGRNQGVIGYAAGRNLKRMPSDAYWGGLRAWGLRRLDLSISEFGQYAASLARSRPERNDDDEAMTRGVSMWAALPPAPDDFLHADITFDLAPTEAQVLVEHIRQHHQGSLLAVLCAVPETAKDAEYPWELPTHAMPGQLVEVLRHARNFSELTAGPQHVYNLLLARRARTELDWDTDELEASQRARLDTWTEQLERRFDEVRSWVADLPAFWALLDNYSVGPRTREFVNAMAERFVVDPEGFAEDSEVHRRIRDRELRLKSKRARLTHRAALENSNMAAVGGQFDFRWGIAKSYLNDIATARAAQN